MKRNVLAMFLIVFGLLSLVVPIIVTAQDATPEATPEATEAVTYDPAACFTAAESNDRMVSFPAKEGPYTIGLSNSYIGNDWRTQMLQMFEAWVATPEIAPLIEDTIVVSTGADVEAQIAAMDNMIASGVDAIIVNAASPTAFDAVVRRATDAGIIVVSFDGIVNAPEGIIVNENQVEFGRVLAEDLVERIGGAGNVVMVNGVAGISVDTDRTAGAMEVFDQYPDIHVIAQLEGNWDSGVAQQVMGDFLATQPDIDGVWIQGGSPGVIQAFDNAGVPLVPMAGEAENAFRRDLATRGADGLSGISIGQTPGMVDVATMAALELLQGRELPRVIDMPLPIARSEDMQEGVDYFTDLPDNFFTPIHIPVCGVNLDPEAILNVELP